ncbi:hypothetical protein PT974_04539 [Cladobotryum mycophilum]|uniref:EF-hand domain-containing protein n=1 Tax=Cladobotryum mycophilum TaxID=491253 RepID=A0ABR0SVI0_9HYPO
MPPTNTSRDDFSLTTMDGNHFDQVIGMSQGIINKSFEQLFKQLDKDNSGVEISFDEIEGLGALSCHLDAPRILLNGMTTNTTDAFYQLRIKKGSAVFEDSQLNLDGWTLTVKASLSQVTSSITPEDSPEDIETKMKAREDLKHLFSGLIPDDYSVQRIFCALSMNATRPTFEPVRNFTQVYPYLSTDTPRGSINIGEGGKRSSGDYNCLLFCENVDYPVPTSDNGERSSILRDLPLQPKMKHSGNLAQPVSDEKEISGSFAIDYRVFLEQFVLPQLQELCHAQQIRVEGLTYPAENSPPRDIEFRFYTGPEVEGLLSSPEQPASDPYFKFIRSPNGESKYQWKQPRSSDSNERNLQQYRWRPVYEDSRIAEYILNGFAKHRVYGDSEVNVSWTKGSSSLLVEGKLVYDCQLGLATDIEMSENLEEKSIHLEVTWSFFVLLKESTHGAMQLKVEGLDRNLMPSDLKVRGLPQGSIHSGWQDSTVMQNQIESKVRRHMGSVLSTRVSDLENRLQSSGKFIYPGHGELKFTNPRFTVDGSVIADAEYRAPTGSNNKMKFPEIKRTTPPVKHLTGGEFPKDLEDIETPRLSWITAFDYDRGTKLGRLTMVATNPTNHTLTFRFIHINLIPYSTKNAESYGQILLDSEEWETSEFKSFKASVSDEGIAANSDSSKNKGLFSFRVKGEEDPRMTVMNKGRGSIQAAIKDKDKNVAFVLDPNNKFQVILQGKVEKIGRYPFSIQEAWEKLSTDTPNSHTFAVKQYVVEIGEDGTSVVRSGN